MPLLEFGIHNVVTHSEIRMHIGYYITQYDETWPVLFYLTDNIDEK
jgi:hypothetical protein